MLWSILFAMPPSAALAATDPACPKLFNALIAEKISAVPGLKKYIEQFVDDPEIPLRLRRTIADALNRDDITVVHLTEELVEKYRLPTSTDAFQVTARAEFEPNPFVLVNKRKRGASVNTKHTQLISGETEDPRLEYDFQLGHSVFVKDRVIAEKNDFLTFIHEIAHVKFQEFFTRNVKALQKKFPKYFKTNAKGVIEVDERFFNYLTERYALETEWASYKATNGRYFQFDFETLPSLSPQSSEKTARRIISDFVQENYGIYGDEFYRLRVRSIFDILRNGID